MPARGQFAPLMERFESKFIPEPNSGCWIWIAGISGPGKRKRRFPYGKFWYGKKTIPAHVASWQIIKGPIFDDSCVLHRCDVPCCVNPHHLFLGSRKDNTHDMIKKGRKYLRRGEQNNFAKLSKQQVLEIFSTVGKSQAVIAREYGITQTCVSHIKLGKSWRHITGANRTGCSEKIQSSHTV